jgi:hypothetical protein
MTNVIRARNADPRAATQTDRPLAQLTLTRFREFLRELEALFWVFIFPILLAAGPGLAFRNRLPEVLKVATITPELEESLRRKDSSMSSDCPRQRLRMRSVLARWRYSPFRAPGEP